MNQCAEAVDFLGLSEIGGYSAQRRPCAAAALALVWACAVFGKDAGEALLRQGPVSLCVEHERILELVHIAEALPVGRRINASEVDLTGLCEPFNKLRYDDWCHCEGRAARRRRIGTHAELVVRLRGVE